MPVLEGLRQHRDDMASLVPHHRRVVAMTRNLEQLFGGVQGVAPAGGERCVSTAVCALQTRRRGCVPDAQLCTRGRHSLGAAGRGVPADQVQRRHGNLQRGTWHGRQELRRRPSAKVDKYLKLGVPSDDRVRHDRACVQRCEIGAAVKAPMPACLRLSPAQMCRCRHRR